MLHPEEKREIVIRLMRDGWHIGMMLSESRGLVLLKAGMPTTAVFIVSAPFDSFSNAPRLDLKRTSGDFGLADAVLAYSRRDEKLWLIPLESLPDSGRATLGQSYEHFRICVGEKRARETLSEAVLKVVEATKERKTDG
jgi:hypothetical protein